MSACAEIGELLELLPVAGADLLEPSEHQALEDHLAGCATCRARAEELERAYGTWSEALEETSMEPLSPTLRERVVTGEPADAKKKKGVVPSGPSVDEAAVEAVRSRVVLSCSFCHDGMARGDAVFCASCLAPHHRDLSLIHI